jgi:hypothetical protein
MYRIVQIVERNGRIHQIPMTAQQANFYLRLTELKAGTDPTVTFHDVVIEHKAKARQARPQN